MTQLEIMGHHLPWQVVAPVFYAIWVIGAWSLQKVLFIWIAKLAERTSWKFDDIVIEAAHVPVIIMIFVWGAAIVVEFFLPQNQGAWTRHIVLALKISTILAGILFVDRLVMGIIKAYTLKVEVLRTSGGFMSGVAHIVVIVLGSLVLLDSMGISITPLIASLGIGSLAVALALQPTLENFFSGIQIIVDRPILPGQFVKLQSGEEGYIEKIGWRSTWLRQLPGNMVIVPNKEVVTTRLANFDYPSPDQAVLVNLGVHYNSDLNLVERVTCEVGESILKSVTGGVPDFKPFIRYNKLDSSSVNFTVILRSKTYVDQYLIVHEFIKALIDRYRKEQIVIPYPITAINTAQENSKPIEK
jgi:small-conductance mechanosensitive channel